MRKMRWSLGLLLAVGTVACSDASTAPEQVVVPSVPTTVVIDGGTALLESIGDQVQYQARVLDQNGVLIPSASVTWETSDASVLALVSPGNFRSAGNGTSTVRARATSGSSTVVGEFAVTVTQRAVALTVTATQPRFWAVGQRRPLQLRLVDAKGVALSRTVPVTWSSSNPAVVQVDGTGTATSVADGSATITAVSEGLTGSADLTVAATVQYQTCFTVAGLSGGSSSSGGQCVSVNVVVRDTGNGS